MPGQEMALQNSTSKVKRFVREVRAEMKKVSWPTRQELLAYTAVVFVSVVLVSALIWVIDGGLSILLRSFIH
ncbi:preprotein translocase subunit SecE [Acetonema longum]|uniref:Protein translocase subunit SecE n=1 Tax=Acetonema longum DSM 6540 TaxID=1009370 RepID=F7NIA6_9FIRM|nr:preprotein translocase subunit SecE [Acetonema longum]EGO64236.1 hypothetical protein ALO_09022 [Acetonema longum DSM 6540]